MFAIDSALAQLSFPRWTIFMSINAIVIYCGLLMTASAVAIDVVLPAFGLMSDDLNADYSTVQLVVPLFIIAAGIGQLFWGSLSDRYGRKPVLQAGLFGFVIGSVLCLLAPNIELMLAGRVIQGLFVASASVISRAIMRDLFSGKELARSMAFVMMIFAVGPIVGPLIGAGILSVTTWRYILFVILIFGIMLLIAAFSNLAETIEKKSKTATDLNELKRNALAVWRDSQSRFFFLISGPIAAVIILILISLPRVFDETFGISGPQFAILFAIHGLGIILGQFLNRHLIAKYGTLNAVITGAVILTLSAVIIVFFNLINQISPTIMVASISLLATSHLIVVSNAVALSLDPHGDIAGFVSSYFGFVSQVASAIIGMILAIWVGGDVTLFGIILLLLTAFNLVTIVAWKVMRQ